MTWLRILGTASVVCILSACGPKAGGDPDDTGSTSDSNGTETSSTTSTTSTTSSPSSSTTNASGTDSSATNPTSPSATADPSGSSGADVIKGEVDVATLMQGVTVTLTPQGLGQASVPLSTPMPDLPRQDLQAEMLASVSLLVTSNQTGESADLMAGLVSAALSQPGAYDWELNATRDLVTMTFVNETPGGLVLTPESTYTVQLAVTTNNYLERVSAIAFNASVQ